MPKETVAGPNPRKNYVSTLFIILVCVTWFVLSHDWTPRSHKLSVCSQSSTLIPEDSQELWNTLNQLISAPDFLRRAGEWLGGSVSIPTVTYDNMGPVGEDPRWDIHVQQHKYLLDAFPLLHTSLTLEKVNTFGLLYTWQGTDPSLKPVLLMAHQDVVPVEPTTVDQWTHAPFSGHFDGEYIWGRGAFDDKSGMISTLAAIELLLENGFKPSRSFVLAIGFDEEVGGAKGAGELSKIVIDRYGNDSFAFVIDEGGGFTEAYGTVFASPGVAEKGSMNLHLEVTTAGGHSSVPPEHTSIGILSALLVHFENHPFEVHLSRESTIYAELQCFARHGKQMDKHFRHLIEKSAHSDKALQRLEKVVLKDNPLKSLAGTTQAIDMIQGGVKTNALPEQAWAVINHRIAVQSSVAETQAHDTALLKDLAAKFNLTYTAFGDNITEMGLPSKGSLTLSAPRGLDPAPPTPTAADVTAYQLLSGTIKATFNAQRSLDPEGDHVIISPGMMIGNTDTRYYWALSPHIYRYAHHNLITVGDVIATGAHTVNERIEVIDVVEMIRFFTTLILNADESRSI